MALRIEGQLSLDGSGFAKTLNSLKGLVAGAFSVGAITAITRKVTEYADNVDEMASRIGVSTKALQEWSFAAKQAGADTERLARFVEKLSMLAADPKNLSAFAALGISPDGMTPEALFGSLAGRMQGRGATEIQSALQSLGFGFKDIGPMVNLLSSDLNQAALDAQRFGAVMDETTVKKLANLNDQLSIISQVIAVQLGPALLGFTEMLYQAALKGGGAVASAGGFWGDVFQKMLDAPQQADFEAKGGRNFWKQLWSQVNSPEAAGAAVNAAVPFEKAIEQIKAIINRGLGTPTLPTVSVGERQIAQRTNRASRYSDSLVSIGNFLGAGTGRTIEAIAQQQLRQLETANIHLRNIATAATGGGTINVPTTT